MLEEDERNASPPSLLSANPSVASSNTMNELPAMLVPPAILNFRVFPSESVRYQPPILIGKDVVFSSSIHVPPAGALEFASFTTPAPASSALPPMPGVPRICLLARHAPGVFQFATAPAGSAIVIVNPSPSVVATHVSL